ncbi:MAG: universal stress protein [candidate division WOR-3 bacterium]
MKVSESHGGMCKLLLATDLSPASEQLIDFTRNLKVLNIEQILLTFCLNISDNGIMKDAMEVKIPTLENQAARLTHAGFQVKTEIRFGMPAVEILNAAEEKKCQLLVIGSHGRNLSDRISLGGTASALLHNLTLPGMVVKIPSIAAYEKQHTSLLDHVLYVTDFSENADAAFACLEKLTARGARKITLLHIQDHIIGKHLKDRLEIFNRIDLERLKCLARRLQSLGKPEIKMEIPYGGVAELILKQINHDNVSLVVMGAQGRGYIGKPFLGGVTNKVLRSSPVPLLVVPFVSGLQWSSAARECSMIDELNLK